MRPVKSEASHSLCSGQASLCAPDARDDLFGGNRMPGIAGNVCPDAAALVVQG